LKARRELQIFRKTFLFIIHINGGTDLKRILLATLLGGLAIFVWGSVYHMLVPFASAGLSELPNEPAVLQSLSEQIPDAGLYFYPWMDMSQNPGDEEQAAWTEKHRNGPVGLLLYKPIGGEPMPPMLLLNEFLSNLATALILALIASALMGTWMKRALLLSSLGVFAWCALSFSSWNWFGFPFMNILSEGFDIVPATFFAGLIVARLVPPPKTQD